MEFAGSFRFKPVVLSDASEEFEPHLFHNFDVLVIGGLGTQTSNINDVGTSTTESAVIKEDGTKQFQPSIVDNADDDRGDDPMDVDVVQKDTTVTQNVVVDEDVTELRGAITYAGDDLDVDADEDDLALSFLEEDGNEEIHVVNPLLTGGIPVKKLRTTEKVENHADKAKDEIEYDVEDDLSMCANPACFHDGDKHAQHSGIRGCKAHDGQSSITVDVVQSKKAMECSQIGGQTSYTPLQKWEYEQGLPVDGVSDVCKWAAEVGLSATRGKTSVNGETEEGNRIGSPTKYVKTPTLHVIVGGDGNEADRVGNKVGEEYDEEEETISEGRVEHDLDKQ